MPRRFDFISPGISIEEIDESVIEAPSTDDGLLLIGRAKAGPAMKPVKIKNLRDFRVVFGDPISGKGTANNDVWRDGNNQSATYASYAAQAWLASETSPVTFVRLAGNDSPNQASGYLKAGWDLDGANLEGSAGTHADNVTAYGLFIVPSASAGENPTGTLAAVLYATGSVVTLSGTIAGTANTTSSAGTLIESISTGGQGNTFTLEVRDSFAEASPVEKLTFHFDPDKKDDYIRNVLNTNPLKTYSTNYAAGVSKKYFLGESYEEAVQALTSGSAAGSQYGLILPLVSGSNNMVTHQAEARPARTGYFINRDPTPQQNAGNFSADQQKKLFRLVSLHDGEWFQNHYYVTIENLKLGTVVNPNSSFTVSVRDIGSGAVVEQFAGCNLDESSNDFIGKKIGDMNQTWNTTNLVFDISGDYPNRSDYIRVEMADDWKSGIDDSYMIPWGVFGPTRPKGFTIMTGSVDADTTKVRIYPFGTTDSGSAQNVNVYVKGNADHLQSGGDAASFIKCDIASFTGSFSFPRMKLTEENTNKASVNYKYNEMFGVRHKFASLNEAGVMPKKDYSDLLRYQGGSIDLDTVASATEHSYVFSLDEIVRDANGLYYWASGSHTVAAGSQTRAVTAGSGSQQLLDDKVRQFAVAFHGGFDGVNIQHADPFSSEIALNDKSDSTSYAHYSVSKAIDIARDSEAVKYDVIAMPGLITEGLNRDLIEAVEGRGDALAIVDIDDGFLHTYENNGTTATSTVSNYITNVDNRDYNSSYAATYYPRVRMRDTISGNGDVIVAPASVAALGALAFSDAETGAPWFAPAGFNRGGLGTLGGPDGPKVIGALKQLTKSNRDDLYQRNVNPVARFPAIGETVIFGQKTLQQTMSALDRINVRRLMIFLKKRVGRVAETVLFDQNVQATWSRFKADADLILRDAQSRLGITEYKLVLDETTTTADLVDQNILYAKVFIKPARAIEYIAIDFIVTRSGIEF